MKITFSQSQPPKTGLFGYVIKDAQNMPVFVMPAAYAGTMRAIGIRTTESLYEYCVLGAEFLAEKLHWTTEDVRKAQKDLREKAEPHNKQFYDFFDNGPAPHRFVSGVPKPPHIA